MKKFCYSFFCFAFLSLSGFGQNVWTQKSDVGGLTRRNAVGFSIGSKGYIGLGYSDTTASMLKDFWEYSPLSDSWTQIADFGGTARYSATAFAIGHFAYVGMGADQNSPYHFNKDFWKYDPAGNAWTSISDFPGTARYQCKAFTLGAKGYIGTGWNQLSLFSDFWEYDPSIDSWSQKATFPGLAREASTAFSVSGFGYMGLGLGSAGAFNDIYKYDAGLNTWSAVADFPSINFDPVSFVIGNIAYVGTGSSTYPNLNLTNHFWQYNPDSNSWSAIPDMGGTKRLSAVSFAIDSFGYCGTGGYGTATYNLGDLWQYGPSGVGISEIKNNLNVSVFPNPANKFVNFHLTSFEPGETLVITDIHGRKIYADVIKSQDYSLALSTWSSGVYFYIIHSDKGSAVGKIVKE